MSKKVSPLVVHRDLLGSVGKGLKVSMFQDLPGKTSTIYIAWARHAVVA